MLSTSSNMIIFILLLLLTKLQLILLSALRIGTDNLLSTQFDFKGNAAYLKKIILWMKTIHYPNTIRSYFDTIVPMASFTPKSTSKLRSALHIRYSIIIRLFISRANTAQT